MPTRNISIDGRSWRVFPSGFVTQYNQDEFGLIFESGTGAARESRITRYSPQGARSREAALMELSDAQLRELFACSQTSFTSPEAGYTTAPETGRAQP
jgi:hypothetical protein